MLTTGRRVVAGWSRLKREQGSDLKSNPSPRHQASALSQRMSSHLMSPVRTRRRRGVEMRPKFDTSPGLSCAAGQRPPSGVFFRFGKNLVGARSVLNQVRQHSEGKAVPAMGKTNKAWHEQNRMPKNPTMQQRIEWHLAHAKACGCREIPQSIQQALAGKQG
jgi:hypothetical protein